MAKIIEQKTTFRIGRKISRAKIIEGGDAVNLYYEIIEENPTRQGFQEDFFPIVEASKLSFQDKIFKHKPQTPRQVEFRDRLVAVIESGISDFRVQKRRPAFNYQEQSIYYTTERFWYPDLPNIHWKILAEEFCPSKKSRLGYEKERNAFLGMIIKALVEEQHYSLENAWYAVCDNSEGIARYRCSDNLFDPIGGFKDLGNGYSITLCDKKDGTFIYFGGRPEDKGDYRPLINTLKIEPRNTALTTDFGWVVTEV